MVDNNVVIEHRRGGSVVDVREGHNVWTYYGKEYLSKLVALQVIDAIDVPQEDNRIKYLGLGIGGVSTSGSSRGPVFMAAYPPGHDPNSTFGAQYTDENPTSPPVNTLERPVRVSGTSNPYPTAPSTDVWLLGPPTLVTYRDTNSITFKFVVDASGGSFVYGSMPFLPVSEAGLFHAGADPGVAYNQTVAYITFATMVLHSDSVVTISWTVRFAP